MEEAGIGDGAQRVGRQVVRIGLTGSDRLVMGVWLALGLTFRECFVVVVRLHHVHFSCRRMPVRGRGHGLAQRPAGLRSCHLGTLAPNGNQGLQGRGVRATAADESGSGNEKGLAGDPK